MRLLLLAPARLLVTATLIALDIATTLRDLARADRMGVWG